MCNNHEGGRILKLVILNESQILYEECLKLRHRYNELGHYVKILYHQREIQIIIYVVTFENDINIIQQSIPSLIQVKFSIKYNS